MKVKAHTFGFWKICFPKKAQYLANKKQITIITWNNNFEQYFMPWYKSWPHEKIIYTNGYRVRLELAQDPPPPPRPHTQTHTQWE